MDKRKLVINVDMDGVVFDFVQAMEDWWVDYGQGQWANKPVEKWNFYEHFLDSNGEPALKDGSEFIEVYHRFCWDYMFGNIQYLMPGAKEVLNRLKADGHIIQIVTSKITSDKGAAKIAMRCVIDFLFYVGIPFDSIIFTDADKSRYPADVVIDDKSSLEWAQEGHRFNILYDQPYNQVVDDRSGVLYFRHTWDTIYDAVSEYAEGGTASEVAEYLGVEGEEYDGMDFGNFIYAKGVGEEEWEEIEVAFDFATTDVNWEAVEEVMEVRRSSFGAEFPTDEDGEGVDAAPKDDGWQAIEAVNLVFGDRRKDYGHPYYDYKRTADMFNALFGYNITPYEAATMMKFVKLSREHNRHKDDNIVDEIGYAIVAELVREKMVELGEWKDYE